MLKYTIAAIGVFGLMYMAMTILIILMGQLLLFTIFPAIDSLWENAFAYIIYLFSVFFGISVARMQNGLPYTLSHEKNITYVEDYATSFLDWGMGIEKYQVQCVDNYPDSSLWSYFSLCISVRCLIH